MVKILGLDIGDSKTGYAIADSDVPIATPRGVIEEQSRDKLISRIAEIILKEKIETIVIGVPLNLKGEVAHQAEKVLTFIKHLKKAVDIPIETIDERLTSKASRCHDDDSYAAAMILQTWLDLKYKKNGDSPE